MRRRSQTNHEGTLAMATQTKRGGGRTWASRIQTWSPKHNITLPNHFLCWFLFRKKKLLNWSWSPTYLRKVCGRGQRWRPSPRVSWTPPCWLSCPWRPSGSTSQTFPAPPQSLVKTKKCLLNSGSGRNIDSWICSPSPFPFLLSLHSLRYCVGTIRCNQGHFLKYLDQ